MKSIKYDTFIKKIIEDIRLYTEFLNDKGLRICFFRPHVLFSPYMEEMSFFFGHPFERCIRTKEKHFLSCRRRQDDLIETARAGEPLLFTCFAGVSEFVLSIEYEEKRYALLALSGYTRETKREKTLALLNRDIPDSKRAKGILAPYLYMFEKLIPLLLEAYDESALSGADKAYKATLAYIADNADRQFSFTELCDKVGYSQAYIGREFKKRTGKSVFEYITDFRIKTAQKLLKDTKLSVTDIAFSVGYADPNYFSNTFKLRVGVSPKAWRKQNER
jgi:AraC-like DNA-binding protein